MIEEKYKGLEPTFWLNCSFVYMFIYIDYGPVSENLGDIKKKTIN